MRFWIDIEDSSGNRIGDGPVKTGQYFEAVTRLSKAGLVKFGAPGSDPRTALVVKKRTMRGQTIVNSAVADLGIGQIEKIERRQDNTGAILLDTSGDDRLRELTNRHVGELLIDDGAGGADDDGPDVIMALAPSGWTLDTDEGYETSYKAVYHQFDGETVLEALTALVKLTGEHFRLGADRTVIWMRRLGSAKLIIHSGAGGFTLGENVIGNRSGAAGVIREETATYIYVEAVQGSFVEADTVRGDVSGASIVVDTAYNPSTGIRAVQGVNPVAAENNTEICIITSLKEIEDSYESQIGRVYAIGSGTGDAKLTLQGATAIPPAGYTLGNDSKGYYLQHDSTWSSYGIERRQPYKDAQDANELYEFSFEYLSRAKDSHTAYELGVTKLDQALEVGKTIRVSAHRWIEDPETGDPYHALNVETDLYILEATNRMDASGLRSASLVVSTVDEFPRPSDDIGILTGLLQQNRQIATHRQPVDASSVAAHASTHLSGGSDAIKLDDLAAPDDNTDLNASTTKHGLLLKLDSSALKALLGDGSWGDPRIGAKSKITPEGGYAVLVTAGENLVAGNVVYVKITSGTDDYVFKTPTSGAGREMAVGVVYGAANTGNPVWVVTSGIVAVLPESGVTAARGNVIYASSSEVGVVGQSATVPTTDHWAEVGHFLDTGTGNGAATRAIVHFN